MKQAICLSLWKTPERGSNRSTSTSSLSRSLQQNPTEWAWGYRFAGRLSLIMAGVWRWPTVSPMDRSFRYFYRSENALAYEATKSAVLRYLRNPADRSVRFWFSADNLNRLFSLD